MVLEVKPHKFFERDGDDLHCVMPDQLPAGGAGHRAGDQTLEGTETIKVPEGTQSGKEFKLRGKGVPHLNSHGKGDLIVEVRVQTPSKLTKQQKELLKPACRNHLGREHAHIARAVQQGQGDVQLEQRRAQTARRRRFGRRLLASKDIAEQIASPQSLRLCTQNSRPERDVLHPHR